jgi:hypothetical protein
VFGMISNLTARTPHQPMVGGTCTVVRSVQRPLKPT